MSYKFSESVKQTITPKKDAYAGKWVRAMLDSFVAKLGGYLQDLKKSIPKKAGGYTLRTSLQYQKPVWKQNTLPFKVRLLVEASHWSGWPDVIDVKIHGKLSYATGGNGNVTRLSFDIKFEFYAREAALKIIKEKLGEASGDKIKANEDIRKYLKGMIETYLKRLKKAVAEGVKDFKKLFEEDKKPDKPGAERTSRRRLGSAAVSPFSPAALMSGVRVLV